MMLFPSIMDLMEKAGNRYSLVIAASKRARKIAEDSYKSEKSIDGARSITKAAQEIADGDVIIINDYKAEMPRDEISDN